MSSLVIWRTDTGEIVRSIPPTIGSGPEPSIETAFQHRQDLVPLLDCAWVNPDITTYEARQMYEVRDGALLPKLS